jgi:hypothetical protein
MDTCDRRLAVLLVAAGLIVQLPALLWGVPNGKAINNALRILAGDVPYRDFWTMYAPGRESPPTRCTPSTERCCLPLLDVLDSSATWPHSSPWRSS